MAGNNFIINALKPGLLEQVDNARKAIEPTLTGLVMQATSQLPASIEPVTAAFKRTYADITNRVAVFLPTTVPALSRLLNRVVDKLVAYIKGL